MQLNSHAYLVSYDLQSKNAAVSEHVPMFFVTVEICRGIFEVGLAKHEERATEVNEFWECINEAKTTNKIDGMEYINNFLEYKKQVQAILQVARPEKI